MHSGLRVWKKRERLIKKQWRKEKMIDWPRSVDKKANICVDVLFLTRGVLLKYFWSFILLKKIDRSFFYFLVDFMFLTNFNVFFAFDRLIYQDFIKCFQIKIYLKILILHPIKYIMVFQPQLCDGI